MCRTVQCSSTKGISERQAVAHLKECSGHEACVGCEEVSAADDDECQSKRNPKSPKQQSLHSRVGSPNLHAMLWPSFSRASRRRRLYTQSACSALCHYSHVLQRGAVSYTHASAFAFLIGGGRPKTCSLSLKMAPLGLTYAQMLYLVNNPFC